MLEQGIPRFLVLGAALIPFLWFAYKDNALHFRARKVSIGEHILHLGLGLSLAATISMAFQGRLDAMVLWLAVFCIAGSADEFGYHRDIPEQEHDVHAKEHFALLLFIAVTLLLPQLGSAVG